MLNGSTYIVRPRIEPSKSSLSLRRIAKRFFPIVGRASGVFRQRTDVSAILHTSDIDGVERA